MKNLLLAALTLPLLSLPACKKTDDNTARLYTAAKVTMGNGNVHSWLESDEQNHPKTLGITLDKDALTNLPAGHDGEYRLELPAEKLGTPFNHIVMGWNPHGHEPDHVYDKPHFDVHFYMIGESDRMAIPAYGQDSTGFLSYPGPGYMPTTYFPIPGGVPMMGAHWADATSPELSQTAPQPFTQTFIYGSYKGSVIFYEPMITLDYLTKTQTFTRDIPQPAKFGKDGYYPTKMSFAHKADGSIDLTLFGFVYRSKS